MKKKFYLFAAIAFVTVLFFACNDNESSSTSTLAGNVTLNESAAAGAIVMISSAPNAASIVTRIVTDENGDYSLTLAEGSYYVSAKFEPNNSNLKSTGTVILTSTEDEISVSGETMHDISMAGSVSGGDGNVSLNDGWIYDNTHSTIGFEFPYDAENANFSGHFESAGIDQFDFDETAPEATKIKAWVDITTVETGAHADACGHGRDGIHGCIAGTFGVDIDPNDTVSVYCADGTEVTNWPNDTKESYDLWGDASETTYEKQSAVIGASGVATLQLTDGLTAYGNGYTGNGIFTFNGVSSEVVLYLNYIEGFEGTDRSGNSVAYSSFYGFFKFAAEAVYGISSGHVGNNDVTVNLSVQFNKAL